MSLLNFNPRDHKRLRALVRKTGGPVPDPLPGPPDRKLKAYIVWLAEEIPARSGATPGSGTGALYEINLTVDDDADTATFDDLAAVTDGEGTAIEVTVWNIGPYAAAAEQYALVQQEHKSGRYILVEPKGADGDTDFPPGVSCKRSNCYAGSNFPENTVCCDAHNTLVVNVPPFGEITLEWVSADTWESEEFLTLCADGEDAYLFRLTIADNADGNRAATLELIAGEETGNCPDLCLVYKSCCFWQCLCENALELYDWGGGDTFDEDDLAHKVCVKPQIDVSVEDSTCKVRDDCPMSLVQPSSLPAVYEISLPAITDDEGSCDPSKCDFFEGTHYLEFQGGTICTWQKILHGTESLGLGCSCGLPAEEFTFNVSFKTDASGCGVIRFFGKCLTAASESTIEYAYSFSAGETYDPTATYTATKTNLDTGSCDESLYPETVDLIPHSATSTLPAPVQSGDCADCGDMGYGGGGGTGDEACGGLCEYTGTDTGETGADGWEITDCGCNTGYSCEDTSAKCRCGDGPAARAPEFVGEVIYEPCGCRTDNNPTGYPGSNCP